MILKHFVPKEERFFHLFREIADCIVDGASEFKSLILDPASSESRSRKIKEIEHRADEITHKTVALLHKTFITPLDREDIHQLISKLDDIVDFIEAAAQRIYLYDMKVLPPETSSLAHICFQSAQYVKHAVDKLEHLKNSEEIIKTCVEINRLENEADHVLRTVMARLFREETNLKELIKVKEICELLETVTDRCEDVANIIEGIVLEYA